jgi:hypothetical protein
MCLIRGGVLDVMGGWRVGGWGGRSLRWKKFIQRVEIAIRRGRGEKFVSDTQRTPKGGRGVNF